MSPRFSIRDVLLVTAIVVLALAWWNDHRRLMLELHGYGGSLTSGAGYDKCRTLAEAVQLARGQLAQDGKREFAALLTEASVRAAIKTAIAATDVTIDEEEKQHPGTKDYWQYFVKPAYLLIAEKGEWPANCALNGFYGLQDSKQRDFEGLGLRAQLTTPGAKFEGYALPVLDVWYGRVTE